jgi:hypothetical protein
MKSSSNDVLSQAPHCQIALALDFARNEAVKSSPDWIYAGQDGWARNAASRSFRKKILACDNKRQEIGV